MGVQTKFPQRIYGVDFSGAAKAGDAIWIAECDNKSQQLLLRRCFSAGKLPASGPARDVCLPALRRFITTSTDSAWGFDFPFSIPLDMMKPIGWRRWLSGFSECYQSADHFLARLSRSQPRERGEASHRCGEPGAFFSLQPSHLSSNILWHFRGAGAPLPCGQKWRSCHSISHERARQCYLKPVQHHF